MPSKNFRRFFILFLALVLSFTGFSPVLAAPPTNDNLAGAAEVTSFPFSATLDISEATDELDEPRACHFMDRTVWYAFTPTERMRVRADTLGSFIQGNVNVYLGAGGGLSDLQFIECSGPSGFAAFTAEAGETYYFQVGAAFGESGAVQFNLAGAQSIMGRVTDAATGNPLPGTSDPMAHVTLQRVCGEDCLEYVNSQYADSTGNFVFDRYYYGTSIPAGTYQLDIVANQYQASVFGPFEFPGTLLDVGDIPLNRPPGIRGRIVDSVTGTPLAGAEITLRSCTSAGCVDVLNSQTTGEGGLFQFISSFFGETLPDGTYELEVAALLYETRRVEVTISNGVNIDIGDVPLTQVPLLGSIRGRLVDAATGRPLSLTFPSSVELLHCSDGNCFESVSTRFPESQGQFRFETDSLGNPLPAGTYQVRVIADQYQGYQTEPFDVGEGLHQNLGDLRIISFPVRLSDIQPCADVPATGGECSYSVRLWNGLNSRFRGSTWSWVSAQLPDSFLPSSTFQVKDPQKLELDKGQSRIIRFRFNVPGSGSSSPAFICPSVVVGQGKDSLLNPVGFKDLFCIFRSAAGLSIASPPGAAMSDPQVEVTVTATGTEAEPNNSCATAQNVGAIPPTLVVDGNLDSTLEPDIDYFRFSGTPGAPIVIDYEGQPTGRGTLENPLLALFDSSCNLLALTDDSDTANSRLETSIPADGVLVIGATASPDFGLAGGGNGSYQLTVTPVPLIGSIRGRIINNAGTPLRGDAEPFAVVYLLRCNDFGCGFVNSQPTDSEGRFLFERDSSGTLLRTDNYQVAATANQYLEGHVETFTVGEAQDYDVGDLALESFPVVFSDLRPCSVPAAGGVCSFSVRITNGLSSRLSGKAWSMVNSSELGSFIPFSNFQLETVHDVRLKPGSSTALRFRFRVPGSVAVGAMICPVVYVGQNPGTFFHPQGVSAPFCLTRGEGGFTLMSQQAAQAASQQMEIQKLSPPDPLTNKQK